MVQVPWETVWWFFKNLNIESPHDPAIPLLGIYPKELKTGIHTDAHSGTFTAALLSTVKRQKQPKWLSVEELIHKLWYIHTIGYYSTIERKKDWHILQHG